MNKRINDICIISKSYPSKQNPKYTFVHKLVESWVDLGKKCTVISPNSITGNIIRNKVKKDDEWIRKTKKGKQIKIYSPNYISFSNKNILGFDTLNITNYMFRKAADKEFKNRDLKPDVIYGHFAVPSGIVSSYLGAKYNIPSFFAFGESSPKQIYKLGTQKVAKKLKDINGVVAVSTKNKNQLIDSNLVDKNKVKVFPNAIDNELFYPRNKLKMRKRYGFDQEDFIVAFVGHYIERKGPLRLSAALNELNDVKSVFIGDGPQKPYCDGILHTGKVRHEKVPEMLSAADVFVLPTLNEGCSNAIIEAMACGLPIISSDREFNYDILNEHNSILIDPNSVNEIKRAIRTLKEDSKLLNSMSKASLKQAQKLNIKNRAKNIINFMGSRM